MSANQPVNAPTSPRTLEEPLPVAPAALEPAPIGTLVPPPAAVVGVPIAPRTGEPRRPRVVAIATVLCWLAYWDAVDRFAEASWLMGQFVTAPGSLERVLLAVAVTVIGILVGTVNAILGYYAWTGYRWTRIAGLVSAALTFGVLVLNQLAWLAIPVAVAGAALLWLPPAGAFFTAWTVRRHPEQVFAPPTVDVVYGPLARYRKD